MFVKENNPTTPHFVFNFTCTYLALNNETLLMDFLRNTQQSLQCISSRLLCSHALKFMCSCFVSYI
jgi:hypothetical protein